MKDLTIVVGTIGQSIMRSEDNGKTGRASDHDADLPTKPR